MNRLYRTSINNKYQSHSNRGMVLENDLNATNKYYLLGDYFESKIINIYYRIYSF